MFVERPAVPWDGDLSKLTTDQLEKVTEELIRQACNQDPQMIEEMKRYLLGHAAPLLYFVIDPHPHHIHRGAEIHDFESGALAHHRMASVGAGDKAGADFERTLRRYHANPGHDAVFLDEPGHLGLHEKTESLDWLRRRAPSSEVGVIRMPVLRNPRHEKFAQLASSGIKPREAYISVGYKPTGAKQAASRLLTKVDVRERVSELQQAAARSTAEAVILNRERVLNRLSQLSHEAQQKGHYSAAARCEELIGKEIGMFVDRREHFVWDGSLSKLTTEQLEKLINDLLSEACGQDEAMVEQVKRLMLGPSQANVIEGQFEQVNQEALGSQSNPTQG